METTPRPTLKAIAALCQYGAPEEDIAAYFGLTVEALRAIDGFEEALARAEAERKLLLRKARMTRALAGNEAAMRQASQSATAELVEQERLRLLAEYIALRSR